MCVCVPRDYVFIKCHFIALKQNCERGKKGGSEENINDLLSWVGGRPGPMSFSSGHELLLFLFLKKKKKKNVSCGFVQTSLCFVYVH